MSKVFASISSLWALFIPLLSVSKVGFVDFIHDCHLDDNYPDILQMIKQLGELRDSDLITQEEFECKKQKLLDYI